MKLAALPTRTSRAPRWGPQTTDEPTGTGAKFWFGIRSQGFPDPAALVRAALLHVVPDSADQVERPCRIARLKRAHTSKLEIKGLITGKEAYCGALREKATGPFVV